MDWSTGAILFYGGIAGAGATIIAAVLVAVVLARGKKRIINKLNQEYGKIDRRNGN